MPCEHGFLGAGLALDRTGTTVFRTMRQLLQRPVCLDMLARVGLIRGGRAGIIFHYFLKKLDAFGTPAQLENRTAQNSHILGRTE